MSRSTEALLWPIKLGLAPMKKLGSSALELSSSQRLAETRLQEYHEEKETREIETAVALAHAAKGKLQGGSIVDEGLRERLQEQVAEAERRIGQIVIDAHGMYQPHDIKSAPRLMQLEE